MAKNWLIRGGSVVTPAGIIPDGAVAVYDGRIVYVGAASALPERLYPAGGGEAFRTASLELIDAADKIVAPGYIDIHVHGGGGRDTMNASMEAIATIAAAHARHGTAVLLPTTMTAPHEEIVAAARIVNEAIEASARSDWAGARVLGMHMEGPYINPEMVGAQNPEYVRTASLDELQAVYDVLGAGFRLITLAPERPGALEAISWLRAHGVTVSMGHTGATYEEALRGIECGVNHATHTYNAMTGLHHRKPGVLGAVLTEARVRAELIADCIHVHPAAMQVLAKVKGPQGLCLITDAIEAMGMPEGRYQLGGLPVILKNGECRLETGSLAGSVLGMDQAVANMVKKVGVDLAAAVRMASLTPAEAVGLSGTRGSLSVGKAADVVLLNAETLLCELTMVEGRIVYRAA